MDPVPSASKKRCAAPSWPCRAATRGAPCAFKSGKMAVRSAASPFVRTHLSTGSRPIPTKRTRTGGRERPWSRDPRLCVGRRPFRRLSLHRQPLHGLPFRHWVSLRFSTTCPRSERPPAVRHPHPSADVCALSARPASKCARPPRPLPFRSSQPRQRPAHPVSGERTHFARVAYRARCGRPSR